MFEAGTLLAPLGDIVGKQARRISLSLLFGVVIMSGLDCIQRASDLKDSLRTQLMQRFPQREILQAGEFAFEPDQGLQALTLTVNGASILPEYMLFKTRLTTGFDEYPFVDVIAAIHTTDHADVRILWSPTFMPDSLDFAELFYGLYWSEDSERVAATEEIAKLFAGLTYQGSLGPVRVEGDHYTYNLYRDNVSQNLLVFEFDPAGKLASIQVTPGSGRK
jgi:hypothetical protein